MVALDPARSPHRGSGRGPADEPNAERPYLLERVDDAAVARIYADGFTKLPLEQKVLLWHLYQAAVAGRDIYYDQRYAHGLEMRDVLESILTHADGIDAATLEELRRYTKLFWLNSGPYNHLTARKFVLKCTPDAFAAAAQAAAKAGATFPTKDGRDARVVARTAPADVLRRRASSRSSRTRRRARGRTSSPPAPTTSMSGSR